MAESHMLRYRDLPEIDRGTGVTTRLLVSRRLGAEGLTSGITSFQPGSKIARHWHNCAESVVILDGEAVCEIDGELHTMSQYDTTFVPENVPHRFLNQTDRPMSILWTYAATYVTRTFADTGVTVEHLSESDKATAPTA
ncbi:MAG TPA: cupin domain-containing protein [Chloroflexota bacterium]|nr:cupin domain-containing protein [Chloroflexota bacterium]